MNENDRYISVIIPMYKVEKYLRRCLDSVVNQTYKNLEIIIVDDGSPDRCGEIAEEYAQNDPRIKVIHQKNGGLSNARNTALDHATGAYIAFVDSDDELPLSSLEFMLKTSIEAKTSMVMGGYYACLFGDNDLQQNAKTAKHIKQIHVPNKVLRNTYDLQKYFNSKGKNFNYVWMKLYKKEIFDGVRFTEGKHYEDIFIMRDIIENAGSIAIIDEPVYYYCVRKGSIVSSERIDGHMDGLSGRIEWRHFIKEKYPTLIGYSQDALLEYCCYLLGKITLLGKEKYRKEWDYVVSCFKEAKNEAKRDSLYLRLAMIIFKISPDLLGYLCMQYSKLKNA